MAKNNSENRDNKSVIDFKWDSELGFDLNDMKKYISNINKMINFLPHFSIPYLEETPIEEKKIFEEKEEEICDIFDLLWEISNIIFSKIMFENPLLKSKLNSSPDNSFSKICEPIFSSLEKNAIYGIIICSCISSKIQYNIEHMTE